MKNSRLLRNIILITAMCFLVLDFFTLFKEHPVLDVFLWFTWLGLWIFWMTLMNKKTTHLRKATEAMVIEKNIRRFNEGLIATGVIPKANVPEADLVVKSYIKVLLQQDEYKDIGKALD